MKVVLISANRLRTPYPVYPLGMEHVAAALSGRHTVRLLDLCAEEEPKVAVREALARFGPDVVGVSIRNIDSTDATQPLGFVEDVKGIIAEVRRESDAIVVVGGSGFTIFPDRLGARLGADFGVVGEGERLPLLLDALEGGRDPRTIAGVVVPGEPAALPRPWDGPIGRSPEVARGLAPLYLKQGGMLNLQTKRGCPYRCTYCTYPGIEGHVHRLFPPEEVAETARALEDAGAAYLFLTDSAFNSHIEHSLAVAKAMGEARLGIPWGAFFAPVPTPSDYYRRLADAGLTHVEFGTESLSERMLEAYRKPFRVEDVVRSHRDALEAGLHVAHYFMLGGPGEDPISLDETFQQIEGLEESVFFFFCGVRIYPGTEVFDAAVEEGQIGSEASLLSPVFYRSAGLGSLDIEELVRQRAGGRSNWIVGSGGERTEKLLSRMYARGYTGPLWEKLVR